MATHRLFLQQTDFNGLAYTKGTAVDSLSEFGVVCSEFPFKLLSESKDVVTKNFIGSHGLDVYIPKKNRIKDYDLDVQFLYCGTHATMRNDIERFLKFLNGHSGGADEEATGSRLVIYDQYTQTGRKDVRCMSSEFGTWWDQPDYDTDAIADFKVRFHVYDPVTNVTPVFGQNQQLSDLTWR